MIVLFGKMVSGVGKTITVVNRFGVRVKAAGGILKLMISPANLVVAGLLALIAVVLICVKNIDRLKAGFQTAVPAFDKCPVWVCWYLYSDTAAHSDTAEGGKHNLGCTPGGRCRSCIGSGRSVCRIPDWRNDDCGWNHNDAVRAYHVYYRSIYWKLVPRHRTGVQTVFEGIVNAIAGIFKGVINTIAGAVNGVIGAINGMTVPEWVPGIGGKSVNLPLIPQLASGTKNWEGGIAQIHERGGEIIDLPAGESCVSA